MTDQKQPRASCSFTTSTKMAERGVAMFMAKENPTRVLDCVNALEGIDDPAAFMRDVQSCTTDDFNFGQVLAFYGTIRKHLEAGDK